MGNSPRRFPPRLKHEVSGPSGPCLRMKAPDGSDTEAAFIVQESTPRGAPRLVETVISNGMRFRSEEPPELIPLEVREVRTQQVCNVRFVEGDTDDVVAERGEAVLGKQC